MWSQLILTEQDLRKEDRLGDLVENETRFYSKGARVLRLLNYTVVINNSEGSGYVTQSVKVSWQKEEGVTAFTLCISSALDRPNNVTPVL